MSKWETVRLGDVCRAESSSIAQKDLESNKGAYPIYGASGLIKYIDFFKQAQPYIAIVKDGAGVGRVSILPANSSVIGTMQYIIPTPKVMLSYLYSAMTHMNLGKHYSGATIPHIYFKDYKLESIPLPPLAEQQKIAAELDKIRRLIAKRKSQMGKLDLLIKSKFVEMFGDPVTNPMGWERASLKKVSKRLSDGPFGSNLKSEHYTENGIRIIRLQNIGVGKFIDKDKAFVSNTHYESLKKYTCKCGEIVIATLGEPNLRACILPDNILISINKADCVHFIPRCEIVNAQFVCQYINNPATLIFARDKIHGQTRPRISSGQVAQIPIYLPPLCLQTQFADFVEKTEKTKTDMQKSLAGLETLYMARMQEYFE